MRTCAASTTVGKWTSTGKVLETPAEPADSTLKNKVRQVAYPCKEAAGIVWAYMGHKDNQPLLPNYEWMSLAPENLYVTKSIQDCSWLQGLEGECDSSHLSFLHRNFTGERPRGGGDGTLYAADTAPQLEGIEMDYGIRMLSCRRIGPDTYLRVSNIVMPCHGFIPTGGIKGNAEGYTIHSHVPIDDTHSMRYNIHFHATVPSNRRKGSMTKRSGLTSERFATCRIIICKTVKNRSGKILPAWGRSFWFTMPAPLKPWGPDTTAPESILAPAT